MRRTLRGVAADEKEKKLARLQQTVLVELYKKKVVENALNVGDKVMLRSLSLSLLEIFFLHLSSDPALSGGDFVTSCQNKNGKENGK